MPNAHAPSFTRQPTDGPYRRLAALLLVALGWLQWQLLAYESNAGEVLSRWSYTWFAAFVAPTVVLSAIALIAFIAATARGRVAWLQRWRLDGRLWWPVVALVAVGCGFAPGPPHRYFAALFYPLAYVSLRWAASGYRLSRPALFRLVAVGMAVVAAFGLAEVGLRVWASAVPYPPVWAMDAYSAHQGKTGRYVPHHYQIYRPRPDYVRHFPDGDTHHNSLGFRGPEFAVEKPTGVYRIVCLGSSTTYTDKVTDDEQTYPALLQAKLRTKLRTDRVEVINAGVPGYTTAESLINMAFQVSELSPDLVILYDAVNHARARLAGDFASDYRGYSKTWHSDAGIFHRSILVRLMLDRMHVAVEPRMYDITRRPLPADPDRRADNLRSSDVRYYVRNMTLIVAMARQLGAKVMFATFAVLPDRSEQHPLQGVIQANEALLRLGSKLNVPVLKFAEQMPLDKVNFFDDVHVNERGAQIKAGIFCDFVVEHFGPDIETATATKTKPN